MMMKDKAGSPQQGENQRVPPGVVVVVVGGLFLTSYQLSLHLWFSLFHCCEFFTSEHLWGARGGALAKEAA